MPVKGLPDAPSARPIKEQKTATIYLAKGIAHLTVSDRSEPIRVYEGTEIIVAVHDDGRPEATWLRELEGEWTTEATAADTKNRDVYVLEAGKAKFLSGKAHVVGLIGTKIVVAEDQPLNKTVGAWAKVSGYAAPKARASR